MIMMMMKLPIVPYAEELELVLSTAPRTWDNSDKDSKWGGNEELCRSVCPALLSLFTAGTADAQ